MYMKCIFVVLSIWVAVVAGQSYEDKRCKCVCPSPAAVLNSTNGSDRKLYIANVPPNKCNCDGVILPSVGEEIKGREQEYCPRCECKYENRNTTIIKAQAQDPEAQTEILESASSDADWQDPPNTATIVFRKCIVISYFIIKVVVIMVIWAMMLLAVYMSFLICLEPLINRKIKLTSYQEHTNEDDDGPMTGAEPQTSPRGNVLNRVTHQQDKWKRQVREQRRNIYDRHTMLN